MPRDLDALATQVIVIVQTALAPLLERLAVTETKAATTATLEAEIVALRERLSVAESKVDQPPAPVMPDLAPILERLAVAEIKAAKVDGLTQEFVALREAVAVAQAKTVPVVEPLDLTPLVERLASAEARLSTLGDLRDRVVVVETKAAAPVLPLPPEAGYDDLRDRIKSLETRSEGPSVTDMGLVDVRERVTALERRVADDALPRELGALRERVAVLEVKPQIPGPKGDPGEPGKDGAHGKDGLAGLSYEGVYQEGQAYEKGHLVTWGGSSWHCNAATTSKPGDGSKDWTLMVKRGRDGRDGHDATGAIPVVTVGRRP